MRVRFTRRSQADATAIFNYLDEKSPQGANSVKRAFKKAVELIGDYPHVGRHSGEQDTRVLPVGRYPYLIYWSIEADEVVIVHVRHAARRSWQGEH
jgi:plasmid stabilization system protein ParE